MSGITPQQTIGLFYKVRVRDVMSQVRVTSSESVPVRELATSMRHHNTGSVVIVGAQGQPLGVVTERDLVYRVVADGATELTARDIMSSPPITIDPDAFLYQAVGLMMRCRCRRLLVVGETGELAGIVSMRDLMRLQSHDSQSILDRIDKATTLDMVGAIRPEIDDFAQTLFLGDVDSRSVVEILTDFGNAVTRRVIFLAQQSLKLEGRTAPPTTWAWVCFGSEGRREQVLRGDQDNGLIVADDATPEGRDYCRELARRVNDDLAAYGFDLCNGGVMAREDKYFGALTDWKDRVGNMVSNAHQGPEQRDLTILLDMRHLAGDEDLTDALWSWTGRQLRSNHAAVRTLADDAVTKTVPLNFLGRFRYETGEGGRRGIDIKKYGMLPMTAGTKALAIDRGLRCTSTHDRIVALGEMGFLQKDTVADLSSAHELFLRLKLQASIEQVFQDRARGNVFYPQDWTDLERSNLKRAFRAVDRLLAFIRLHFAM